MSLYSFSEEGVAVPVSGEGEEVGDFGGVAGGNGSIEEGEVAVEDGFALLIGYVVGDEGEGSHYE